MSIKIGHASIDERGKAAGGKVGDQTGKEICTRQWYKKPWNVYLECLDASMAAKAADYMRRICNDSSYGYDQNQRTTGYDSIKKNGVAGGQGEFDCSSLVSSCYNLAGLNVSPMNTTSTLKNALLSTGKFKAYTDRSHVASDKYASIGGIYLSEGHHVVMALENGSNTVKTYKKHASIKIGSTGSDVKKWQKFLVKKGYKIGSTGVDGVFGKSTEAATKKYQKDKNLKADGVVGIKTWTASGI